MKKGFCMQKEKKMHKKILSNRNNFFKSLHIDTPNLFYKRPEVTKGLASPPYTCIYQFCIDEELINAGPCPHCPYFSTKRNYLNTHILAYHRHNYTYELSFEVENFIESFELQYLESPMDQIQVSKTATNQDFLSKTTSKHDSITESGNILPTQPDLAELSEATSSFFESLTIFMKKKNRKR